MSAPELWALTDHACGRCFGRVLQRKADMFSDLVRCAECGLEAAGDYRALCACGHKYGALGHVFQCVPNVERNAFVPQEVLVVEQKNVPAA